MYIDENSAGAGRPRVWMTKINGSTYRLLFVLIATWVLFVWIDPKKILNNTDDDAESGQEPQE